MKRSLVSLHGILQFNTLEKSTIFLSGSTRCTQVQLITLLLWEKSLQVGVEGRGCKANRRNKGTLQAGDPEWHHKQASWVAHHNIPLWGAREQAPLVGLVCRAPCGIYWRHQPCCRGPWSCCRCISTKAHIFHSLFPSLAIWENIYHHPFGNLKLAPMARHNLTSLLVK